MASNLLSFFVVIFFSIIRVLYKCSLLFLLFPCDQPEREDLVTQSSKRVVG